MTIYEQLQRDEGVVLHPYHDSLGFLTWGIGHKVEPGEVVPDTPTEQDAFEQLVKDVQRASQHLENSLPWISELDEARRGVLLNMTFNMGIGGLLGFHRTLTMIEAGNYEGAAEAMLQSKWATQVGIRATRLSQQMRTGEWV